MTNSILRNSDRRRSSAFVQEPPEPVYCRQSERCAGCPYTLLPEPVSVDALTADAPDITVTLCNNADFVLPFTGGRGFAAPILFAALMLGMGVYFCKKSEFKKENN